MHVELWDETTLFCRQLEWAKRRKLAEWTISWVCKSSLPPDKRASSQTGRRYKEGAMQSSQRREFYTEGRIRR